MLKKLVFVFSIAALIVIVESFIKPNYDTMTDSGPVKWYTFGEAVEMQKKAPKPIMVDIYTTWCGPCKMMSSNTFGNPIIAKYLNENFYPVKFDAECYDTVKFNDVVFTNKNPKGTVRGVHDFAISILDGKLSYPSIVFINEEIKRLQVITGYYKPEQFEPIVKFFGSGKHKDTPWEEYQKTFVSEFTTK